MGRLPTMKMGSKPLQVIPLTQIEEQLACLPLDLC